MLVPGILGFHGILVISFLFFCLVIRQKWKNATARKADVAKLLAVAAKESLMAEVEATTNHYNYNSVNHYNSVPGFHHCAVCFSPTTTRCSRCKAARYCSGKCQIIHWRQGHKNECCPPTTIMSLKEGSDFGIAVLQEQFEIHGNVSVVEGKFEVCSEASSMMDDDANINLCADSRGTNSGFTSSSTIGRPERPLSGTANTYMHGTKAKIKKSKQTTLSSPGPIPGPTSSVLVDDTSRTCKLDKVKLNHNDEEVNLRGLHPKGNMAMCDDVEPAKLGDRESIGGAASSELLLKDASKNNSLSSLSCSASDSVNKDSEAKSQILKGENLRSLSSSAPCPSSATRGHSVTTSKSVLHAKISSIPSLPQNACHGLKTSMKKVAQQFKASKPLKSYMLGSESEVAGKYIEKTVFPYDLFMKLYSHDKVELCPFGLTNIGNSCYANAVLQCLAFTRPLTSYLVQGLHSKACQKKEWCFICEFERLIRKAREGNSPVSPYGILSKIKNIGSHLGHGREEDAHEFLRCAVDTMQSVCLKEARATGLLAEETTLAGLTFGGYLRSKIKCLKCHSKSELCERMMDLTVEIDGDIETLEGALAQFTETETLVGENKYHCSRCKSYEKAKKKLTILEEPNILTIVLKRFQSGDFGKLNKSVRFPEILNMAPYMSGNRADSPVYSLYAVVVHLDVMNAAFSGHYVCYVKNSRGEWFRIDDSNVMPVESETVLLERAYMLLYARMSPRPPALITKNLVSNGARSKRRSLSAIPSGLNTSKLRFNSNIPSADSKAQQKLGSISNHLQYRQKYDSMQRIPTMDSSSENSSIFSGSDASSCSTSTKGSSRSDDLSDFIFGEVGPSWYSHYGISSDSVASSSISNKGTDSGMENDAWRHGWREGLGRDGHPAILYSDSMKHYRNSSHQFDSSNSSVINSEQVVWTNSYDVNLRRASGDRSAQTFY